MFKSIRGKGVYKYLDKKTEQSKIGNMENGTHDSKHMLHKVPAAVWRLRCPTVDTGRNLCNSWSGLCPTI